MRVEVTGLDAVIVRFRKAPPALMNNLRAAVEVTATRVKNDARDNIKGISSRGRLPHMPGAVKYDPLTLTASDVETKVKLSGRQARLIGPIESGTPFSAPKKPLENAAKANEEDFDRGVRKAIDDALG